MVPVNRQLIALIVGITVIPLAVLLFLGWRLLDQDRILERQQAQQSVEHAADLVVAALERAIANSGQRLVSGATEWPDGAVAVRIQDDAIEAYPKGRMAYVPMPRQLPEARGEVFAAGEALEFAQHDTGAATETFRRLSQSTDPAIKAGALLRLGRTLIAARRVDDALRAYDQLSSMDNAAIDAVPAGLVGRYAQCEVLERENRSADLRASANLLLRDIESGRWQLAAPVYFLYWRDSLKWVADDATRARRAEAFSEALDNVWDRRAALAKAGGETLLSNSFVVIWQRVEGVLYALIADSSFVQSQWIAAAEAISREQHVSFSVDPAARPNVELSAKRNARDTNLPWSVFVAANDTTGDPANFAVRRRLMIGGFALLIAMAAIVNYVIVRAVNRELAVARLQADFVSAVSHEFRTPLTALRQFTDILRNGEIDGQQQGKERRLVCYDAQSRATDRLTRLVESLLDFGRMEAGAHRYAFADQDCSDLVSRVVEDFQYEVQASGYDVTFVRNGAVPAHVDRDALSRALRNLLENAMKYSPDHHAIEVTLARNGDNVRIDVHDHGIGIPANERHAIFSKFQRGEQAQKRGIKGTGIGLAMVDEIVKAHHGRVEVQSEVGKGSTFTIVLPVEAES
jgi:signal transduction histidine kinase